MNRMHTSPITQIIKKKTTIKRRVYKLIIHIYAIDNEDLYNIIIFI